MIDNLKIEYRCNGILVQLSQYNNSGNYRDFDAESNFPYDLAEMFARVIKDSNSNSDITISQLIEEFDYQDNKGHTQP